MQTWELSQAGGWCHGAISRPFSPTGNSTLAFLGLLVLHWKALRTACNIFIACQINIWHGFVVRHGFVQEPCVSRSHQNQAHKGGGPGGGGAATFCFEQEPCPLHSKCNLEHFEYTQHKKNSTALIPMKFRSTFPMRGLRPQLTAP